MEAQQGDMWESPLSCRGTDYVMMYVQTAAFSRANRKKLLMLRGRIGAKGKNN